jgi:N,N-dimethylformamidase
MVTRGHESKPVVGYSDPLCVAPGEPIRFMVSTTAARYHASIVRLRHGDPAPGGPGLRYEPVGTPIEGSHEGGEQPLRLGSYVEVPHDDALEPRDGLTLQAWVFPTKPGGTPQGLLTKWSGERRLGYGLFLEPEGDLSFRLDDAVYRTGAPLRTFEWAFVAAVYDPVARRVTVRQAPVDRYPGDPVDRTVQHDAPRPPGASGVPFVLAGHAEADGPVGRLNGKLDSPRLYGRALAAPEPVAPEPPDALAVWDLVTGADSDAVPDVSGNGHHGRAVNLPMRGVTGRNWRGEETAFHRAPREYNAMFFHDDDLDDAGWEPGFELVVPDGTRSGVYAARLVTEDGEDWVPFFVRPPRGTTTADVVFLVPTLSYLAYANEHSAAGNPAAAVDFDLRDHYQPEDHYAIGVPVTGLYDHHADGTGVCFSSWRRPIVNMRPHYHLPLVRSAHQLAADLHLIDWLEEKNIGYDVVTDHDLHREGAELLARYRVTLTGSHPEYWTGRMLDGLQGYLGGGGRLMYLGGNGFYWVTSISPSRPHVIEVRRGRRGTGTWRSAPGEDHHATTGELGGLWRDRGRTPQRLVGVGMDAQGFDRALAYRRTPGSHDPRVGWIFEGVPADEPIGAHGLVMGGAAGLEIDRLDHGLGTPPHALLLATADGFSDSYQHVIEEVASSDSQQGGTVSPYVRADMVFYEGPDGGAVFSTGSIAWCGALSHAGYTNAVSRITENVLRCFARKG